MAPLYTLGRNVGGSGRSLWVRRRVTSTSDQRVHRVHDEINVYVLCILFIIYMITTINMSAQTIIQDIYEEATSLTRVVKSGFLSNVEIAKRLEKIIVI